MWVYWCCIFGPGHQGVEDGFRQFPDDWDEEEIQEELLRAFDHTDAVMHTDFNVRVPDSELARQKKVAQRNIEYQQAILKDLSCQIGKMDVQNEDGRDEELVALLDRVVTYNVAAMFLEEQFSVRYDDVRCWAHGLKRPVGPFREVVMRVVAKAEKYPERK